MRMRECGMTAGPERFAGSDWTDVAGDLRAAFGSTAFEARFSLDGNAAVRVLAPLHPIAPRHAEPPDPAAPWSTSARCGDAIGWLLADAPPEDARRTDHLLQGAVARHSALALQRRASQRAAMEAELLESLTHRLRTDVSTLQAVSEGLLGGVFAGDELELIPRELRQVGEEAQRRLSLVREVLAVLHPDAPKHAEPLVETLRAELEGVGAAVAVEQPLGERPMTSVPGGGWSTCARLLADALAKAEGPAGSVSVRAHPDGWEVTAGRLDVAGPPAPWMERTLGELVYAGYIAVVAGGAASAERLPDGALRVRLTVPAAPSG
jgi:signal transduction histidine kinase